MPLYEYECLTHHHRFEKIQSVTDAPLTACEICGAPVRKVYHPAGIIFKGSGWYKTDSRPASSSTESKSETKSESPKPSTSSTSVTPETKSDSKG